MNWNDIFKYNDGNLIWNVSTSNRVKVGDKAGNIRKDGYKEIKVNNKRYLVHRLIWEIHYGYISKDKQIDHINGIRSDNRIENLRLVTNGQNQLNSKLRLSNKIGIKGIYRSSKNKWAIWCGNVRSYADDFFTACCIRKSWESDNDYCRKNY